MFSWVCYLIKNYLLLLLLLLLFFSDILKYPKEASNHWVTAVLTSRSLIKLTLNYICITKTNSNIILKIIKKIIRFSLNSWCLWLMMMLLDLLILLTATSFCFLAWFKCFVVMIATWKGYILIIFSHFWWSCSYKRRNLQPFSISAKASILL